MRAGSILLVTLLGSATPLAAQQDSTAVRLPEIVVTSTRLPTARDAVTSSVTVISGAELRERGVAFVADALRDVPGAAVVQTGGPGGSTSLYLRGGESDYVKVLVDGVPVNRAGGAFDLANLSTDDIDRIEVVRGPASVLYGSDAVTGVIQIFTRSGRGPVGAGLSSEAGSFGTTRWSLRSSGGGPVAGYSMGISRLSSDGIYRFNSGYGSTTLNGLGRWRPDARTDVAATARFNSATHHFPTDFTGAPTDHNQRTHDRTVVLGLDAGRRVTDRLELRAQLGVSDLHSEYVNPPDVPGGDSTAPSLLTDARRQADLRLNYTASPGTVLTGGATVERLTGHTDFPAGRTTAGVYAQAVTALFDGLALNVNARVDDDEAFGAVRHLAGRPGLSLWVGAPFAGVGRPGV